MNHHVCLALLPLVGLLPLHHVAAAAPAPRLVLSCREPTPTLALCDFSGQGFRPHDRVAIAYRVVVRLPGNAQRQTVYRRTAMTDRRGTLTHLSVQFVLAPHYQSYEVTVQVTAVVSGP